MASMLWALREMRGHLPGLSHEIWFAGLMSEETSQHGSKALAREEQFDFVIAAEPTGLEVVHTHKGSAFLDLQTTGVAGHASRPEIGENAIAKMLSVLDFIRGDLTREFARIHDPALGSPTISIGTIRGGSKTNIIPDSCEATVDMRFVPAQCTPDLWSALEARLRAICPDVRLDFPLAPPLYTDPAHPLIAKLASLGAQAGGSALVLRCVLLRGARDAGHRARAGIYLAGAHEGRMDLGGGLGEGRGVFYEVSEGAVGGLAAQADRDEHGRAGTNTDSQRLVRLV